MNKIKGILIAALFMCACGRPAEKNIVITYANFPPSATFPCVQMERWKNEVEKRSGGRVKVKTFPGGTLLGPKNMFDGVISGIADIGNFAMSYQPGRFPVSEAVDLPVGFKSARQATFVLMGLIDEFGEKEFDKVKVLALFTCAPSKVMSSRVIPDIASLKGAVLRVSGTASDTLSMLGVSTVAMPMSDTPEALQKGTVAGVVSSPEILKDMNFAAYCPYLLDVDLNVVSFAVVMNRKKYDSLPRDIRAIIDDMYEEQSMWTADYADSHCREALTWAEEKYGLSITDLSGESHKFLSAQVYPLINDYSVRADAAGLDGKAIINSLMRLRDADNI